MGIIVWAGLRQLEALRDSVAQTLERGALPATLHELSETRLSAWLQKQGLGETAGANQPGFIHVLIAMEQYFDRLGSLEALRAMRRSAYPRHEDVGVERSGAGWTKLPNFLITSAFVRLLGASEQFEMDVLKALFYYRPSGPLGHPDDQEEIEATDDVVWEQPSIESGKEVFAKPVIWTWIKKHAENIVERKKIYRYMFGIDAVPEKNMNRQRDELYEKRNAIAHGRKQVIMTLGEYCDVELFVAKSILGIAAQCMDKLKVIV